MNPAIVVLFAVLIAAWLVQLCRDGRYLFSEVWGSAPY